MTHSFSCTALNVAVYFLFALLTVSTLSNAAPVSILEGSSSLSARGNAPSIANQMRRCPTVAEALEHAQWRYLDGNALFWSGVSLPQVNAVARQHRKIQLRDVFSDDVRHELMRVCDHTSTPAFLVMSKAMAELAQGEAWVLKAANAPYDQYWEAELATMKHHRKVTELWRVDTNGNKLERIPLH